MENSDFRKGIDIVEANWSLNEQFCSLLWERFKHLGVDRWCKMCAKVAWSKSHRPTLHDFEEVWKETMPSQSTTLTASSTSPAKVYQEWQDELREYTPEQLAGLRDRLNGTGFFDVPLKDPADVDELVGAVVFLVQKRYRGLYHILYPRLEKQESTDASTDTTTARPVRLEGDILTGCPPKNYSLKPEQDHSYSTGSIGKGEGADVPSQPQSVSAPLPKPTFHRPAMLPGESKADYLRRVEAEVKKRLWNPVVFVGDGTEGDEDIPF